MKNSNIKNILKITSFVLIFLGIIYFLTWYCKPESYNIDNIKGLGSEQKNSLDMVYIGGSASFVYWQPLKAYKDIGLLSYDYSTDTIQPELYTTMIKEILKTQNPSVILVDVRAFQYRDHDQPPTEASYRNMLTGMDLNLNKLNFINNIMPKYLSDGRLSYIFDIIKFHSTNTSTKSKSKSIKMALGTFENETKGFYFVPKVEEINRYDFNTNEVKKPSKETSDILVDLLKYMNTTKTKFLFVVSPYSEQKDHKKIFNYVEEKAKEYGYDFLDTNEYYDVMNLDFKKDFYNYNHVNIFGSEKYTNFLEEYLSENYYFNEHDKSLDSKWNSLINNWDYNVKNTKKIINSLEEKCGCD